MYAYVGEIHTQMSQFQGAVLLSEERRVCVGVLMFACVQIRYACVVTLLQAAAEQAQVFTLNALLSDSAVTAAAFAKNATSSLRTLLLLEEKLFLGMAGPMSSAEEV